MEPTVTDAPESSRYALDDVRSSGGHHRPDVPVRAGLDRAAPEYCDLVDAPAEH
jgi:hypothetical protein